MSQPIKVRFSNFLSEIEQMEEDNKTLTEDLQQLEKEKEEGYKSFNTETHVLVERRLIDDLGYALEEAYSNCDNVSDEAQCLENQANEVRNGAGYARDEVYEAQEKLKKLLISSEKVEEGENT